MNNIFRKPFSWAIVFSIALTLSATYVLLDTFVITKAGTSGMTLISIPANSSSSSGSSSDSESSSVSSQSSASSSVSSSVSSSPSSSGFASTMTPAYSYSDDDISVAVYKYRQYDTQIYAADIQVSGFQYLKAAFASNTFGRNYTQKTSTMAKNHNAIIAINGDYYGFRDKGFVIRNGVLYRSTVGTTGGQALLVNTSGDMSIVTESETSTQELSAMLAWQVWSFGPALIKNSAIAVTSSTEVNQSSNSNPRTGIGQISSLHYLFVTSDGRTSESAGLSLLELAEQFRAFDCTIAYNLDGGGSTTMCFKGNVINKPVNSGSTISERSVSDIVYIGKE